MIQEHDGSILYSCYNQVRRLSQDGVNTLCVNLLIRGYHDNILHFIGMSCGAVATITDDGVLSINDV